MEGRKIDTFEYISFRTGMKDHHWATVAIALLQEFWNLGIGTRMFENCTA